MKRGHISDIQRFTAMIYRENSAYVALCPELDVASQGESVEVASKNLRETVELFLEATAPSEVAARTRGEVYIAALNRQMAEDDPQPKTKTTTETQRSQRVCALCASVVNSSSQ